MDRPEVTSKKYLSKIKKRFIIAIFSVIAVWASDNLMLTSEYKKIEGVGFQTEYRNSDAVELGDEKTERQGVYGEKETIYRRSISVLRQFIGRDPRESQISSKVTKEPISAIILKGARRWQYMHCSDGGYRYFTDDQMKNQQVGFTSKSPDYCAQHGQGKKVSLADTAPAYRTYTPTPPVAHRPHIDVPTPEISPMTPPPESTLEYNPPPLEQWKPSPPSKIQVITPKKPERRCWYYRGTGGCN